MSLRHALAVLAALGLASCMSSGQGRFLFPSRPTFGLFRDADGSFYGIGYPCHGLRVSAGEFGILESKENGEYTAVLRVDWENPVELGAAVVPLSDAAIIDDDMSVVIFDAAALERFSKDRDYLTSVRDEYYPVIRFYLANGEEKTGMQSLSNRFDIEAGKIDLLGDEFSPGQRCDDGSLAWPGLADL